MRLDSVRSLKAELFESLIAPLARSSVIRSAGVRAQQITDLAATPPTIALGIVKTGRSDFALAARVQKRALEDGPHLETIRKKAKGEIDIRYIGLIVKRAAIPLATKSRSAPAPRRLDRPLQGHRRHARLLRARADRRRGADPLEQSRPRQ